MITEDFITVQDAARELSVTESAVHNALAEGRLAHTVVFGRKLISRSDLDAYKLRTRPDGEKPKGRPLGVKNKLKASEQV